MNEGFVTYELAVKLREKGFREKCLAYYDVEDNVGLLYNTQYTDEALPCQYTDLLQSHNTGEAETQPDDSGNCVDAPTISQVMRWLRKKKIIISIFPHPCGWQADIYKDVHEYYDSEAECYLMHYYKEKTEISHSYNWLEIYCIQYVLDNLI